MKKTFYKTMPKLNANKTSEMKYPTAGNGLSDVWNSRTTVVRIQIAGGDTLEP